MPEVDTPEGYNPEAEAADDGRPVWLPENFKSPEDLVKSYNEAQTKIRDQGTQLNALTDNYATLSSQIEEITAQQNRPDPNAVYSQWQEMFENDPVSTVAQIAQATAQQVHQQYAQQNSGPPAVAPEVVAFIADQTLSRDYPDWDQYKGKVSELIAEDPLYQRDDLYANPEIATRALTSAYERVKAQDILSGATTAEQQQNDSRLMKINAQSAVGASSRPAPADDWQTRWAEIQNAQSGKLGL